MKNTQKTFTIKLHTTDTEMTKKTVEELMDKVTTGNEDLSFTVENEVKTVYSFLNDTMAFSFFIRKTKEEFLQEYPYFAEEYDFCLSEFNKHPTEYLMTFLENTSTEDLTEPYGLTPPDFSFSVGEYIKKNMTLEEKTEFLKLTTSKGLKIEIY